VEFSRALKKRSGADGRDRPIQPSITIQGQSIQVFGQDIWSLAMAQVCDVCGKGPQFGNNISHAHNVTRRRWSPNLQAVHAVVKGAPKRIRVCTNCIKSGKVVKA
jgi:large subunit ribosomal protein L28